MIVRDPTSFIISRRSLRQYLAVDPNFSMMVFRAVTITRQSSRLVRGFIAILLLTSVLLTVSPASFASKRKDENASYTLTMQTLHCPWFSVEDDLVSLVHMKNTTANEMNVYLTVRFGKDFVDDGSYEDTAPITLGPFDNKTINIRQLITNNRKLFKQAKTGGIELLFFGSPTDLIAKTAVLSLKHRQSFDVPFINPMLATSNILDSVQWYIGGDYRTFIEIKNTTTEDQSVTLVLRHGKGIVTEQTFDMPAQRARAINVRDFKSILDGDVTGSAELHHNGIPGAIVANSTIMSPGLGLSFDSPFIPRAIPKE